MVAQGVALVFGAEVAAVLQNRHHLVDEFVIRARQKGRRNNEAIRGAGVEVADQLLGDLLGRAGPLRNEAHVGSIPPTQLRQSELLGVHRGREHVQLRRHVAILQIPQDRRDRRVQRVLRQVDAGMTRQRRKSDLRMHQTVQVFQPVLRHGLGLAQHRHHGGEDLRLIRITPRSLHLGFDVVICSLHQSQIGCDTENGLGPPPGEAPTSRRQPGLQDHRLTLR